MLHKQTKKDIYILGIHDGHGSGAVILKNGRVVCAISEERLTMVKNQAGSPILSLQKVFEIANIKPSDITFVTIASKIRVVTDPQVQHRQLLFRLHNWLAPYFHSKTYIHVATSIIQHMKPRTDVLKILSMMGFSHTPIQFIDHHTAHAASAYYRRPWKDKTLIFTLDGMGDGVSATVSVGSGTTITRIAETGFFDSPSDNLYSEITEYLGMKRSEHEYKVMGLAPYGNYKETIDIYRKIIRLNPNNTLEFQNQTRWYMSRFQQYFQYALAKKRFDHIAAGVQRIFEELVTAWIKEAVKLTHITKIVASGGSFLNVKANMLIRQIPLVSDVFVHPACDDCGIAEGAALAGYYAYCKKNHIVPAIYPLEDIYYGCQYDQEAITEFLEKKKLLRRARKVDSHEIAQLLSQKKIIARFSGRDEWGPRALGNRSIMADPRDLSIVHRLNSAIKQRDFWMPFAPAILAEDQNRYVKNSRFAPYMIETFETKEKTISDIVAAIHPADRTTRPMTVNNWNPCWQEIIREFKKITGVGAIINTSFNLHGYPMVGTPEQALWTFENSDLDGLVLEDYLITKKK